jgi:hypothetical protein
MKTESTMPKWVHDSLLSNLDCEVWDGRGEVLIAFLDRAEYAMARAEWVSAVALAGSYCGAAALLDRMGYEWFASEESDGTPAGMLTLLGVPFADFVRLADIVVGE